MRLNEIQHDQYGKCLRISYLPSKDDILPDMEYFSAGITGRGKKIHISSLGADFTFAQMRTIIKTMSQIMEDNK